MAVEGSSDGYEKIKAEYLQSIPNKIQSINKLIDDLQANQSQTSLAELKSIVHKIAGNAGSFGFQEATTLCKSWDQRLGDILKTYPKDVDNNSFTSELKEFVNQLEKCFSKS